MKKISIIIPCYNVEKYVEICVNSVLNQKTDFEVEVIIIDDESTDESLSTAKKLASENPFIKVISQKNKGLGGARNTGIINANGKYILFLDADDFLAENALLNLINLAEKHDVEILEFAATGIDNKGNKTYQISNKIEIPQDGFSYYNQVRYMNSACNKLYKRDFLIKNNFLFLEQIYIEDFEFNTRVFAQAEKVLATNILGAYFLQSSESITRNKDEAKKNKMQKDLIKVIKITADIHKKIQKNEKKVDDFFNERLSFLTTTLFYQLLKRNASYTEVKEVKNRLVSEKIFFANHKIYEKEKEIFRRILVKNMYLYPIINAIKKWG